MASKNRAIKKAAKQLRALLKNLDESEKISPLIKNLLTSLTKAQIVRFNKKLPKLPFNKKLAVKGGVFNKTVDVKFSKAVPNGKFNKLAPALPFNKK